jgi:hypothetical protein
MKITKQYLKEIINEEIHNQMLQEPDEETKKQELHKALAEDPDYDYIADYTVPQKGQSYEEYQSEIAANIPDEDAASSFFAAFEDSLMMRLKNKRMQDLADADKYGAATGDY